MIPEATPLQPLAELHPEWAARPPMEGDLATQMGGPGVDRAMMNNNNLAQQYIDQKTQDDALLAALEKGFTEMFNSTNPTAFGAGSYVTADNYKGIRDQNIRDAQPGRLAFFQQIIDNTGRIPDHLKNDPLWAQVDFSGTSEGNLRRDLGIGPNDTYNQSPAFVGTRDEYIQNVVNDGGSYTPFMTPEERTRLDSDYNRQQVMGSGNRPFRNSRDGTSRVGMDPRRSTQDIAGRGNKRPNRQTGTSNSTYSGATILSNEQARGNPVSNFFSDVFGTGRRFQYGIGDNLRNNA